jgi:predicted ATPase
MKIVITGTTCSGKSTTLKLLEKQGFLTVPESALEIISEQLEIDGDILPNKDIEKFQAAILKRQIEKEDNLLPDQQYFLDRSIIDQYGYCNFYNIKCPSDVFALAPNRYDKVFMMEPLDFIDDRFSYEKREDQLAIDIEIKKAYQHFGYDYEIVPLDTPEERVNFILKKMVGLL